MPHPEHLSGNVCIASLASCRVYTFSSSSSGLPVGA